MREGQSRKSKREEIEKTQKQLKEEFMLREQKRKELTERTEEQLL
jgi:hypothetical protein